MSPTFSPRVRVLVSGSFATFLPLFPCPQDAVLYQVQSGPHAHPCLGLIIATRRLRWSPRRRRNSSRRISHCSASHVLVFDLFFHPLFPSSHTLRLVSHSPRFPSVLVPESRHQHLPVANAGAIPISSSPSCHLLIVLPLGPNADFSPFYP
jgi:hypothetical protein